jgi:NTE family protein
MQDAGKVRPNVRRRHGAIPGFAKIGRMRRQTLSLNLALQGGGAHGAFTWGVLDALLEDGRVSFDGVSGTSAGAMNALVLAQGWMDGGRAGARAALRTFWSALAGLVPLDGTVPTPGGGLELAPALKLWLTWSHYVAPVHVNPLGLDPLRALVEAQIDFERLRRDAPFRLFVAATHANSGRLRLFRNPELSADALLASACLPTLFKAPLIDGEPYWDGGYAANPAVFPLLQECPTRDTLLVLLTPLGLAPLERAHTASRIRERVAEIAFTAAFRREMQALARERVALARRWWPWRSWGGAAVRARFHLIDAQAALGHLAAETKLAVSLRLFEALHALGRESAQRWLAAHVHSVGRRDSVDWVARFA